MLMMNEAYQSLERPSTDPLLEEFKAARGSSAELKVRLAVLRSSHPEILIFSYEGIDDKAVYYHWIRSLRLNLEYEPFICSNKAQLLQLFDLLQRDRTGLINGVFFFVDRDFDSLRGRPGDPRIFLTPGYSIENHIVNLAVLTDVLIVDLHCHAEPACRDAVLQLFSDTYDGFLRATRDLNFRIYLARMCGIAEVNSLPDRINQIASVELHVVLPSSTPIERLVQLVREPSEAEIAEYEPSFDALDRRLSYRGKFAMLFFRRWLQLLVEDRNNGGSSYFSALVGDGFVARCDHSIGSLASKSPPPPDLEFFLTPLVH